MTTERIGLGRAWSFVATFLIILSCSDFVDPDDYSLPGSLLVVAPSGGSSLGTLGGSTSQANAVNTSGQIVGDSRNAAERTRAFLWMPGTGMQDLVSSPPPFDSVAMVAWDINDSGVIVGDTGSFVSRAFRFANGAVSILEPFPGGDQSSAIGVNSSGVAIGTANGTGSGGGGALWDVSGNITSLGTLGGETWPEDISDSGVVVGASMTTASSVAAFKWSASSGMSELPAPYGYPAQATGINGEGRIVGLMRTGNGENHAVIWEPDGSITDLGTLGGSFSAATAISDDGIVVGFASDGAGVTHGFVWSQADGMESLGANTFASAISNQGLIVGTAVVNGNSMATQWQVFPSAQPGLECDSVQRRQVATCRITIVADSVVSWSFSGDVFYGSFQIDTVLNDPVWSGVAVQSGLVSARVVLNGVESLLQDTLVVTDRPWGWNAAHWTFSQGAGQLCGNISSRYQVDAGGSAIRLGLNTRTASCAPRSLDPDIQGDPAGVDAGWVMDSVTSGLNRGLFFTDTVLYRMDRGSSINPSLSAGDSAYLVTAPQDRNACRGPLGLGPQDPVYVNFYAYNKVCRGNHVDATLIPGIWNHEGFGTLAQTDSMQANGHEARRRLVAVLPGGDPYSATERLVSYSDTVLRAVVASALWNVDSRISSFAGDHNFVRGNWCGSAWVWHAQPVRYYSIAILQDSVGACL